jgi:hypothetical protein
MSEKLTYLAVHTRGYDSTHDLVILAGPRDSLPAMYAMADRMSSVDGKRHVADAQWVYGMAEHSPHVFYGYRPGEGERGGDLDTGEVSPALRISLTAQRTARDIDADADVLLTQEYDKR